MEYPLTFKLFLIIFLFFLSGFFSCSEAALFSLNELHLHQMAKARSPFLSFIKRLLRYPRRLLITILAGNEAVNITISALMASVALDLFSEHGQYAAVMVATPLILVFADTVPKTFGITNPVTCASFLSPFLEIFYRLLGPVVWLLEKIAGVFVGLFPKAMEAEKKLTADEFRELIDTGRREGALEEVQRGLIHRVFLMNEQPASEIMVPRVDMFSLPVSLDLDEMEREITRYRHSLVPIYEEDRDNILGILPARALINCDRTRGKAGIKDLLIRPYFVPLERTVGSLLHDFRTRGIQMAIVVDEYGGVEGLVTLEDIVEILFSDVYDEHGLRSELKKRLTENSWLVSGGLTIDELVEMTGIPISADEIDTVGGLVFHLFGKVPLRGEEIVSGAYRFRVEQMRRARIMKVLITREGEEGNG